MTVTEAVAKAEQILPGKPAPDGDEDPRWQAIIDIAGFIESDPESVWEFTLKWGSYADEDLRMAVATCLLEHLLEHHFDLIFPKVEATVKGSKRFFETFYCCSKFGQSELPENSLRLDRLKQLYERT